MKEIVRGCMDSPSLDLQPDTDLWAAGITSMQVVRVMIAVEEEFEIELPEEVLTRETFTSVQAITQAVRELVAGESRVIGTSA
ncbi:acyl carrier protein [Micromonospora sp. A202]|uniref:acyl carrier protein n=1 Tax=Micromonospora sp. A202 TaxID=2572899 RepID=UPI002104E95B|nr:acyl carrier protein [Micromonospora sp. A202]